MPSYSGSCSSPPVRGTGGARVGSITNQIIKTQEVLKKMYESFAPVRGQEDQQFAKKHLSHLLLPLEGHTGLSTDLLPHPYGGGER